MGFILRPLANLHGGQGDVFQHGLVGKKVEGLEHHAHFGAQFVDVGFRVQHVDAVVQQHTNSDIVNFALNVFPSPGMCTVEYGNLAPENQDEAITCQATSQFIDDENPYDPPEVPFAETITIDTYDAIHQVLNTVGNCGGTPISKSLSSRWNDSSWNCSC